VTFSTTVVALGWSTSRAVAGLVRGIVAVVATSGLALGTVRIHYTGDLGFYGLIASKFDAEMVYEDRI